MATNSNITVSQNHTTKYSNLVHGWDTSHPTTISKKFIILIYHYLHAVGVKDAKNGHIPTKGIRYFICLSQARPYDWPYPFRIKPKQTGRWNELPGMHIVRRTGQVDAYWDVIRVLLSDAHGFHLALLERVRVLGEPSTSQSREPDTPRVTLRHLELGSHRE